MTTHSTPAKATANLALRFVLPDYNPASGYGFFPYYELAEGTQILAHALVLGDSPQWSRLAHVQALIGVYRLLKNRAEEGPLTCSSITVTITTEWLPRFSSGHNSFSSTDLSDLATLIEMLNQLEEENDSAQEQFREHYPALAVVWHPLSLQEQLALLQQGLQQLQQEVEAREAGTIERYLLHWAQPTKEQFYLALVTFHQLDPVLHQLCTRAEQSPYLLTLYREILTRTAFGVVIVDAIIPPGFSLPPLFLDFDNRFSSTDPGHINRLQFLISYLEERETEESYR